MMNTKKMIKRDILEKFKELESEENILPDAWLKNEYLNRLNKHEKDIFEKAVGELASNGLVEYKAGVSLELKLTGLGETLIFQ